MYPNFLKKKERRRIKGKKKESKKKKKEKTECAGEEREIEKGKMIFSFLSKIYGDRTDGFHRCNKQSSSTYRELHVGTKI